MNMCTWNIRGLNKLNVFALLETRVKRHNSLKIRKKFGNKLKWEDNYDHSDKCRIWLPWDPTKLGVTICSKSSQILHGLLVDKGSGLQTWFTIVSGLHTVETRKPLWQALLTINGTMNAPWCVMGDFNVVASMEDRVNGANVITSETQDFAHLLNHSDLGECRSVGHFYSWSNKSLGEARTYSEIDRFLVNALLLSRYTNAMVDYMNLGISDHSPLVLKCVAEGQSKGRPFKLFNYMAEYEEFIPILENTWGHYSGDDMMQNIWRRLKDVKQQLKRLHI